MNISDFISILFGTIYFIYLVILVIKSIINIRKNANMISNFIKVFSYISIALAIFYVAVPIYEIMQSNYRGFFTFMLANSIFIIPPYLIVKKKIEKKNTTNN